MAVFVCCNCASHHGGCGSPEDWFVCWFGRSICLFWLVTIWSIDFCFDDQSIACFCFSPWRPSLFFFFIELQQLPMWVLFLLLTMVVVCLDNKFVCSDWLQFGWSIFVSTINRLLVFASHHDCNPSLLLLCRTTTTTLNVSSCSASHHGGGGSDDRFVCSNWFSQFGRFLFQQSIASCFRFSPWRPFSFSFNYSKYSAILCITEAEEFARLQAGGGGNLPRTQGWGLQQQQDVRQSDRTTGGCATMAKKKKKQQ